MRKLYLSFQNSETLSHKLTWSHYFEILKADEPLEISFYTRQAALESWSVRELKRQMKSMLFHRLALSKDKESVLAKVKP
jgi:predicted nuclease of restriction endonuclease-like (RecB) superfamily